MKRSARTHFGRPLRSALIFGSLFASAASCSSDEVKPRGQLMLAISTDLSITKDMNQVGVEVFGTDGVVISAQDLDIMPAGTSPMPGTLAVVPPNAGGQTVRIKVTAKRLLGARSEARVVRQAIVKVPTDRVAMLRMPLHWLCDENSKAGDAECGEENTCKAGVCVPADVDADALPDYSPALVFGGGDEHGDGSDCLDVQHCFADAEVSKKPSVGDCSLPLPDGVDRDSLNVAMVLPPGTDGHCLKDPVTGEENAGTCFMPFDLDPEDGFTISKGRIKLPAAACQRKSVTGIAVSTICHAKELSIPICGPWNGWGGGPSSGEGGAGGAPSISQGGEPGGGNAGRGGMGVAGGTVVPTGGTGGRASEPCPVAAERAPAYYYVVVDGTGEMQSLPTIRQALSQFANQPASEGVRFGLQVIDPVCAADYTQPLIDFTPLPNVELPTLQPQGGKQMFLDSALGQTLDTLLAINEPASKTLVVITGGVDQACGNSADLMHQTLTEAANAGVSLRSVLVVGADAPTDQINSGLRAQGSPAPVQMSGQTLQVSALVTSLDQFRDVLAPCTYLAPSATTYNVQQGATTLSLVSSAAQCSDRPSYYKQGKTIVLCPSICNRDDGAELQTDECSAGGGSAGATGTGGAPPFPTGGANSGGASSGAGSPGTAGKSGSAGAPSSSCPPTQPDSTVACTTLLLSCSYGAINCLCDGKTWTCK